MFNLRQRDYKENRSLDQMKNQTLVNLSRSIHSSTKIVIESKSPRLATTSPKKVVFSAIQPTGVPHIGNYIGALRNWVRIANENKTELGEEERSEIYYSVVGHHAITMARDPDRLRKDRLEMMAILLAIGLRPDQCCLFNQDQVSAHTELGWILGCMSSMGRLTRMTTWKSQMASYRNSNSIEEVDETMLQLGLLSYPVLQSADILLYQTTHVPVGDDQEQHIELTRSLAKSFNQRYKANLFWIPEPIYTPQSRILNLRNPTLKMSKSIPNPNTRILLTDNPKEIKDKIQSAVTDSKGDITYDPIQRPGVSNLIDIFNGLNNGPLESFENKTAGELKEIVIDRLIEELTPIQIEFKKLMDNQNYIEDIFQKGNLRAKSVADQTLRQVKTTIGLI